MLNMRMKSIPQKPHDIIVCEPEACIDKLIEKWFEKCNGHESGHESVPPLKRRRKLI